MAELDEPQPLGLAEAKRLWNLQKRNEPLSERDQQLLEQAWVWQMWVSHGIRLKSGNGDANGSSLPSESSLKSPASV